jgi:hypothetical protein
LLNVPAELPLIDARVHFVKYVEKLGTFSTCSNLGKPPISLGCDDNQLSKAGFDVS